MDALDPVIHAPARLRLMSTLNTLDPGNTISFTRLQDMLELTPGNLITHLRKLADAGYVEMSKADNEKTTSVALTDRGRVAYADYRRALEQMLT